MNDKTEPKTQTYRWVQTVLSQLENSEFQITVGTTSECDRCHGLPDLVSKHLIALTINRPGIKPANTWIGFTSSNGKSSMHPIENFLKDQIA